MYARDRSEASRLDGRRAVYQFDEDRDLPWHELSSPGRHMPAEFLAEAGFNVPALDPDLASLVDWAFALSTCETFIALERVILEFAERERAALPECRSIGLLRDEEIKHIHMFERYAEHLRACRPQGDRELFERAFAPEQALLRHLEDPARYPNLATCHYVFWLNTVFVEEYTIYFADRLDREPGIQPMWRALHAAHRREESQHVVTDAHFLESLQLDDQSLREQSQLFAVNLLRFFDTAVGLGAVLAVLAAAHPGGALRRAGRISASPLFQAILGHRHFKRTRRFAPYLVESV
jgi:hypothetical protein